MGPTFRWAKICATISLVATLGLSSSAFALPAGQFIEVIQGGITQSVISPYAGVLTGAANYNFVDFGGVPINGPDSAQRKARLFFYEGADGLHFNVLLNTDGAGNGTVDWTLTVGGNSADAIVQLSDDSSPLVSQPELREPSNDVFVGAWSYTSRVDGGVIGPFAGSNWTITIDQLGYSSTNDRGINEVQVFNASGALSSLTTDAGPTGQIKFRIVAVPEPISLAGIYWIAGAFYIRRPNRGCTCCHPDRRR